MINPAFSDAMLFVAMTLVLLLRPQVCSARKAANEQVI